MANKRRPQGDGTIRKRPDGRWEGRIIIGHKKDGSLIFKSVFGKTQKATLKALHQLIDLYRDVDLTEECEKLLAKLIAEKKAEIKKMKKRADGESQSSKFDIQKTKIDFEKFLKVWWWRCGN